MIAGSTGAARCSVNLRTGTLGSSITERWAIRSGHTSTQMQALAHATEPRQPLALLAAHRLLGELDTDAGRYADAATHLDTVARPRRCLRRPL